MHFEFNDGIDFPKWYILLKWLVPIIFASLTSLWIGCALTGLVGTLTSFQWLTTLYSSAEGVYSLGTLLLAMGMAGSFTYMSSTLLLRGFFLFPLSEMMVTSAKGQVKELQFKLHEFEKKQEELSAENKDTFEYLMAENKEITAQFNQLKGVMKANNIPIEQYEKSEKAANDTSQEGKKKQRKRR